METNADLQAPCIVGTPNRDACMRVQKRPRLSHLSDCRRHPSLMLPHGGAKTRKRAADCDAPEVVRDTCTAERKEPSLPARSTSLVLVSGGCHGADDAWATAALTAALPVEVMSFDGHKVRPDCTQRLCPRVHRFSSTELWQANAPMRTAARRLGRKGLDSSRATQLTYRDKLLCRNYHIVRKCTHLFAVGALEQSKQRRTTRTALSVRVGGGTGWACQLFADECLQRLTPSPPPPAEAEPWVDLPMWLLDQPTHRWLQCRAHFVARDGGGRGRLKGSPKRAASLSQSSLFECGVVRSCKAAVPPSASSQVVGVASEGTVPGVRGATWLEWVRVPAPRLPCTGRVAGVGTRRLSRDSRAAIANVVMGQ